MALPLKRAVEDTDFIKARTRQHRKFLFDVVLPHLEEMPVAEEFPDQITVLKQAVLNLNEYTRDEKACKAVSGGYDCGRTGCFAGWYLMISDKFNRLLTCEAEVIEDYDTSDLAEHFGISDDDAEDLFSTRGSGAESSSDHFVDTRECLQIRKKKLKSIMRRKRDFN